MTSAFDVFWPWVYTTSHRLFTATLQARLDFRVQSVFQMYRTSISLVGTTLRLWSLIAKQKSFNWLEVLLFNVALSISHPIFAILEDPQSSNISSDLWLQLKPTNFKNFLNMPSSQKATILKDWLQTTGTKKPYCYFQTIWKKYESIFSYFYCTSSQKGW